MAIRVPIHQQPIKPSHCTTTLPFLPFFHYIQNYRAYRRRKWKMNQDERKKDRTMARGHATGVVPFFDFIIIIAWPSPPCEPTEGNNNNKFKRRQYKKKGKESIRLDTRVESTRGQTDSKIEQAAGSIIVGFHVPKDAANDCSCDR